MHRHKHMHTHNINTNGNLRHHNPQHGNNNSKNILIAFVLNFVFSIFEVFGGFYSGSVAILSDALHDFGDASSIAIYYFLEKVSKKEADNKYTCGYERFSLLGGFINATILLLGSIVVVYNALLKIINPSTINSGAMIVIAVLGFIVNLIATLITQKHFTLNQKAINLHMLEDCMGWLIVLVSALVIKSTGFVLVDPILSIVLSLFIFYHACLLIRDVFRIFLNKTPDEINIEKIKEKISSIKNIEEITKFYLFPISENNYFAILSVSLKVYSFETVETIKETLKQYNINNSNIEVKVEDDDAK